MNRKLLQGTKITRRKVIALIVIALALSQTFAYAGAIICRNDEGHVALENSLHCRAIMSNENGLPFIKNPAWQDGCQPCADTQITTGWAMNGNSTRQAISFFETTGFNSIANLFCLPVNFNLEKPFQTSFLNKSYRLLTLRI